MSGAEQWAELLGRQAYGAFTLKFERLGLEAQCRSLSAGEVEECLRMGGEKGLRYALYLACDDLRQAGESLKIQGALASAFDITEKLSYGDVVAAGAAILGQSGTDTAAVSMEGGQRAAQSQGMVGLFNLRQLEKAVDMGIFRQQDDAEGIPIQPGQRMECRLLAGFPVVSSHEIGQGTVKTAPGRMNEHSRGLIHRQQVFILVKNGHFPLLGRVFRRRLVQTDGDHITGLHGKIRVLRGIIDPDGIAPFEPVHEPCGHFQLPFEKRGQPPCPARNHFQFHGILLSAVNCCLHALAR